MSIVKLTKRTKLVVSLGLALGIGFCSAACKKKDAAEHMRKAETYSGQGQLTESIIEYRSALQLDGQSGEAHLKLGDAYAATKDLPSAVREYIRAADLLPDNADAQLKAGDGLILSGRFDDARAIAEKVLSKEPRNAHGQILLGNALAGLKDFEGAIVVFEGAIAADPSQQQSYANLGTIQFVKGNQERAEAAFQKAIAAAPKLVEPRLALANFYWASRRQADAESVLKAALDIDSNNVMANRALGLFYLAIGRVPEAEPYFKALARNVETPAAKASLAQYYAIANRHDDARKVLNEILTQKNGVGIATLRLAALDAVDGQLGEAEKRLSEFIAKNPKDLAAHILYADILLREVKRDEAEKAVAAAISLDANSVPAHLLAGRIQAQKDKIDAAIGEYEKAYALEPRSFESVAELARLHLTMGHVEKSITFAQQGVALAPQDPRTQALLVRAHLIRGDKSGANEIMARLRKDYPNAIPFLNLSALVQVSTGNPAAARPFYARALELDPRNVEALNGIVQLDILARKKESALERLDGVVRLPSPSADLLFAAARGYFLAREPAKSEEVLKRAIGLDPSRLQGYSLLGQLYAQQNRLQDARGQFEALLKQNASSVPIRTMIGIIHQIQGRFDDAETSYRGVLAINPRAAVAANNLAWLYVSRDQKIDEALQLAQTAFEQLPREPQVADTLGWIFLKKDMNARGVALLETAARSTPDDPGIRYHLGVAYYKVGAVTKSRTELEKALSLKPSLEGADDARKILATISRGAS